MARCGNWGQHPLQGNKIEDFEELKNMVSSFRVSKLQILLGFAGWKRSGCSHDLFLRALHLLKSGCTLVVQIKIEELYRRQYPETLEGLSGT